MVNMTRRVTNRALTALIVVGGLAVATVLAVLVVTKGDLVENDGEATTYLLSGRADVPAGQTQDDVTVARGVVTIDGTVEDDVLVGSGRVWLTGIVHGDVIVLRGSARLGPDAEIDGDLRTSRPPRVADGAVVRGDTTEITALGAVGELPRSLWFALWLAGGLTVLAAGLLLPRPVADAARAGVGRPARAAVLGILALVVAPLAAGVLALSLLGLGLALVVLAVVVVAAALGSAAAAVAVGRTIGLREGPTSFLAGWGVLGAGLALALLATPLLAALAAAGIVAFGIGALVPAGERPSRPRVDRDDDGDLLDDPDDQALLSVFERLAADDDDEPVDDEPRILAAFPIGSGAAPSSTVGAN